MRDRLLKDGAELDTDESIAGRRAGRDSIDSIVSAAAGQASAAHKRVVTRRRFP